MTDDEERVPGARELHGVCVGALRLDEDEMR
jgi:hypothetical protein